MSNIKDKFLKRYLPMWAKECVFAENLQLRKKVERLEQENKRLRAYIDGFKFGTKLAYRQRLTQADTCVCCGAIIPEGQMVCPNCQGAVKEG